MTDYKPINSELVEFIIKESKLLNEDMIRNQLNHIRNIQDACKLIILMETKSTNPYSMEVNQNG